MAANCVSLFTIPADFLFVWLSRTVSALQLLLPLGINYVVREEQDIQLEGKNL